jgi:hypothetical protein
VSRCTRKLLSSRSTQFVLNHDESDFRKLIESNAETYITRCYCIGKLYRVGTYERGETSELGQTDSRIASIEVKVKKLDGELARYKEQMSKLRNGPGRVRFITPRSSKIDYTLVRMQSNNGRSEL